MKENNVDQCCEEVGKAKCPILLLHLGEKRTTKWRVDPKKAKNQVGLEQRRINRMGDFGRCDGAVHPSSSSSSRSLPPPVACASI